MTLVSMAGVGVRFGTRELLEDVSFVVVRGERWGVLGRNGSGKTTLFNLIRGEMDPSGGTVVRSSGLRVTVMDQYRDFGDALTVWEAAADAFAELFALERALGEQAERMAAAGDAVTPAMLERYDRDLHRFDSVIPENLCQLVPVKSRVVEFRAADQQGPAGQEVPLKIAIGERYAIRANQQFRTLVIWRAERREL